MGTRKPKSKANPTSLEARVERLEKAVFGGTRRWGPRPSVFDDHVDEHDRTKLPSDDAELARLVLHTAAAEKRRWVPGAHGVFISHVIERLQQAGYDADPDAVKADLVRLHRAGHITLTRADLVEAMKPEDVEASETRYLNAQFHFIEPSLSRSQW